MATSTKIAHCPVVPPVQHLSLPTFVSNLPLPEAHPCPSSVTVEAQLISAVSTVAVSEEKENAPAASVIVTATALATATAEIDPLIKLPPSPPTGPIERLSVSAKRFISSFRGRTVHGVEAPLPKGYSGIVLRGDAEGRTQTTTTGGKAKRRPARKLRREEVLAEDDDMVGILPLDEERSVRVLKPSARFDSFVLWHPDIPVDEEMDEYLRSLSEWVNIASEIHQCEALPT